jgi:hypothetical protein
MHGIALRSSVPYTNSIRVNLSASSLKQMTHIYKLLLEYGDRLMTSNAPLSQRERQIWHRLSLSITVFNVVESMPYLSITWYLNVMLSHGINVFLVVLSIGFLEILRYDQSCLACLGV